MKSSRMTIQMKGIEQYFPVVQFIMPYTVVLTTKSVDEILMCDHSCKCEHYFNDSCFFVQFQADSSSTLPCPLNIKVPVRDPEFDGSDGVDSAGIFVHESTQVIISASCMHIYLF